VKTFACWMIGVGAALLLVATIGGHYLQYVIGHDNASVVAALVGALAGSILMQGVTLVVTRRRRAVTGGRND
jgi:outer membrane lipoprotein SlyB